jgi:hypothetical protein
MIGSKTESIAWAEVESGDKPLQYKYNSETGDGVNERLI